MEVCKKAQRVLGLIRRNLWACMYVQVKSAAYTILVRPLLEYATTAWDSSTDLINSSRLNRVQRQAGRFCKREYSREEGTVTRILNELEWQPLEDRREIKVTMLYKISQGLVDIVASGHLVQQFNKGTRGHNQKYRKIRYRTSHYGDTFFPSTIPQSPVFMPICVLSWQKSATGLKPSIVLSWGGTHIFGRTEMCRPNGSLFYKKSLNMGPVFYPKYP